MTAGHPAAGGLTNSFEVPTNSHSWQLTGAQLPTGAITIANFIQRIPPTVANLADLVTHWWFLDFETPTLSTS